MAGSLTIPTASETAARLAGDAALDGRLSTVENGSLWGSPAEADVLTFISGLPAWRPPSGGGGTPTIVGTPSTNLGASASQTVATGRTTWRYGTLNANLVLTATLAAGAELILFLAQDATGGRTLTVNGVLVANLPGTAGASFLVRLLSNAAGDDFYIELATQGPQGIPGTPGATGVPGLVWFDSWDALVTYQPNDAVPYGGRSYRRRTAGISAGTPAADTTNWALLSDKGDTGLTGAGAPAYGLISARPSAASAGDKSLYVSTDEGYTEYQVQSGAWVQVTKGVTARMQIDVHGPGTYSKSPPSWAVRLKLRLGGSGTGAGSGAKVPAGTIGPGGGAGAGGAISDGEFLVSDLTWPINHVVGAAPVGGASVTANGTNGNAGGSGNPTYIGPTLATCLLGVTGGTGGAGGVVGGPAAAGGASGTGTTPGASGAGSSATGAAGTTGNASAGGPGGGSGGGLATVPLAVNGGTGNRWNGRPQETVPATGVAGSTPSSGSAQPGTSGGGGASSITGNAVDGGAGGTAAGGGGGGAGKDSVGNSGKGGDGGPGFSRWEWLGA